LDLQAFFVGELDQAVFDEGESFLLIMLAQRLLALCHYLRNLLVARWLTGLLAGFLSKDLRTHQGKQSQNDSNEGRWTIHGEKYALNIPLQSATWQPNLFSTRYRV
ncbi:MAG TPA: hypothetical protein VHA06_11995, partial [Candidatus Angelobacter sp.]|nr:hypothetical protein [Candidatus Angelobacter sp.]